MFGLEVEGASSKVRLAKSSMTELEEEVAAFDVDAESSSKEIRSVIFAVGTTAEPPLLGSMLRTREEVETGKESQRVARRSSTEKTYDSRSINVGSSRKVTFGEGYVSLTDLIDEIVHQK